MTKITTPRGQFIWPKLNDPDTKWKPEGKYECKIAFDADAPGVEKLQEQIEKLTQQKLAEVREELISKGKKALADKITTVNLLKPEEDDETGEETGRLILKAGMTASGVSKKTGKPWKRKPDIFDGRGNLLKNPPKIGSGTVGKLSIELAPYYAPNDKTVGVSFRLEGAQIIKLVSFGERDASAHGFGAEEDADELEDGVADDMDAGSATASDDEDDDL